MHRPNRAVACALALFVSLASLSAEARRSFPRPVRSESTQWLQVLSIENRRQMHDPKLWISVKNPSKSVAKAALLALGRLGDTTGLEAITELLARRADSELKQTAATALALMSDETALKILSQNVAMQKEPEVISALYVGIGRVGEEKSYPTLALGLGEKNDPRLWEGACEGIGLLWNAASPKLEVTQSQLLRMAKLLSTTEEASLACAFALSRFKGDPQYLPLAELIEAAMKATSRPARPLIVKTIGKVRGAAVATFLTTQVFADQVGIRIEALKGLANQLYSETVGDGLRKALADPSDHVVYEALEAASATARLQPVGGAGPHPMGAAVEAVQRTHASPWIRATALKALVFLDSPLARQRAGEAIANANPAIAGAGMAVLLAAGDENDVARVMKRLPDAPPKVVEEVLEVLAQFPEERFTGAIQAPLRQLLARNDTGITVSVAQIAERFHWKEFAAPLAKMFPLLREAEQAEARVAILNALGATGDVTHLAMLDQTLRDPDRNVVAAAVEAIKALGGRDYSARIPVHSSIPAMAFTMREVEQALASRVVLKTARGEITLRFVDEAPLTALNFVRLVQRHFYDGKTFHRVVPHFVVQGGDPRGDGFGGPGYTIRDELSLAQHRRGTVGLATSGLDSGGSQFFINTAPNLHLDGRYTLFAEVVSGIEVADLLEPGDRILSAELHAGASKVASAGNKRRGPRRRR